MNAIQNARYVYIAGNGGSASTANHFANDLVKLCKVRAISLCANEAIVMAYANDNGYDNIFVDQLKIFMDSGDILITISGSGASPNIVNAKKWVNDMNGYIKNISAYSFPTMRELNCSMQIAEDKHLQLVHKICTKLSTSIK